MPVWHFLQWKQVTGGKTTKVIPSLSLELNFWIQFSTIFSLTNTVCYYVSALSYVFTLKLKAQL